MLRTVTALAALLAATPALAQPAGEAGMPDPNDRSDTLTIAVGGAIIPDYEGSDDSEFTPFAAVRGRVGGMSFFSRGTYLYLDLLRRPDSGIDFDVGPIVGVRRERTGKVKDDFVDDLPERDTAIELGGFAGVTFHGLTNPYDALSFRLDVVTDVGNAHEVDRVHAQHRLRHAACRAAPMSAPRCRPISSSAAMPNIIIRSRRPRAASPACRPMTPTAE